jgi:hypothetical protein
MPQWSMPTLEFGSDGHHYRSEIDATTKALGWRHHLCRCISKPPFSAAGGGASDKSSSSHLVSSPELTRSALPSVGRGDREDLFSFILSRKEERKPTSFIYQHDVQVTNYDFLPDLPPSTHPVLYPPG